MLINSMRAQGETDGEATPRSFSLAGRPHRVRHQEIENGPFGPARCCSCGGEFVFVIHESLPNLRLFA